MGTDDTFEARIQHLREQLEARDAQNEETIKSIAQALIGLQQKGQQDLGQLAGQIDLLFRLLLGNALDFAYLRADLHGLRAEQFRLFWHEPYGQVSAAVRNYCKALWDAYLRTKETIMTPATPPDQAFQALSTFERQTADLQAAANLWGINKP